ncbi:hypothetical protein [Roseovarius ramblicola]|uniref:Uncharacterized protein n=1 Tax=Roseovarius ramblicola TaxID=2022336 RepID=A0ABV5HUX1_9RHOB
MPHPTDRSVTPPRHARLFELLRQQEYARAVAARLAARPPATVEATAPLARLNGHSLLGRAARHG